MADSPPDRVAATLAGIRERWSKVDKVLLKPEVVPEPGYQTPWLPDVPRLLAAVEAALKLADDWDAEGMRLDAQAYERCARELREALTTALAGEEDPGGLEARPR